MSYYPQQTTYLGPAPYQCSTAHVVIAWILGVGTGLYMLPWAIAATRNRPNVAAIAMINLFLGWSIIGWVVALVMACGANPLQPIVINQTTFYLRDQPPQPVQSWPTTPQHPVSAPVYDRAVISNDTLPLELDYQPYGSRSAYEPTQPLPTTRPDPYPGWNPQQ